MHTDIVCGLDIGASSIRALIAQAVSLHQREKMDASFEVCEKILGFSESATKGFSKGVVSDLSVLSDAIEVAVSKAEEIAHCRVRKLITNISGVHIRTFKSRGSVHISDRPTEITEQDIKRCMESAKLIAMSLDREAIYLIPEKFVIDDKMEIDQPLGLFGSKLDLDLNIITALTSILQNLTKSVNLAEYEVEDMIISGVGTALAIFDQKELIEGAVIIDVGKDITEVTLFIDGKLRDYFCFPFGSDDLTQVLQDTLKMMFKDAEALRIRYGIVAKDTSDIYDGSELLIPPFRNTQGPGEGDTQTNERLGGSWVDSDTLETGTLYNKNKQGPISISRSEISKILFPKLKEIVQEIYKKIEPFLNQRKNLPHIRVVGGISKMDGFVETVEEIFNMPVDMGAIRHTKDLHDISFACSLGLARHGLRNRLAKRSIQLDTNSPVGRFMSKIKGLLSEYF